jgi:phage terminase small subunit
MKKSNNENVLTDKQVLFAKEYIKDFNSIRAAIRSGYTTKNADVVVRSCREKLGCKRK